MRGERRGFGRDRSDCSAYTGGEGARLCAGCTVALAIQPGECVRATELVGRLRDAGAGAALHGLVPIISRNSALAEAVNGVGIQVDPHSVSEIGEAMESALALDEGKRDEIRKKLVAHAQSATRERFLAEWKDLISSELQ